MDPIVRFAQSLQSLGLLRFLPKRFLGHYLYPLIAGSGAVPYDASSFFDDWYRRAPGGEFSDGITLSHRYDPAAARFHYASLEDSIASDLRARGDMCPRRVLDIGSGAGHWIDFYRGRYGAEVAGVELAASAAARLAEKYAGDPGVSIHVGDVGAADFASAGGFDLINAIGVMFHIVEDARWERAIANLARQLAPGGLLLVSGQFGWLTQNVLFHREGAYQRPVAERKYVHKRIRSLRRWRRAAAAAGLRIDRRLCSRDSRALVLPENNLLALQRACDSRIMRSR